MLTIGKLGIEYMGIHYITFVTFLQIQNYSKGKGCCFSFSFIVCFPLGVGGVLQEYLLPVNEK